MLNFKNLIEWIVHVLAYLGFLGGNMPSIWLVGSAPMTQRPAEGGMYGLTVLGFPSVGTQHHLTQSSFQKWLAISACRIWPPAIPQPFRKQIIKKVVTHTCRGRHRVPCVILITWIVMRCVWSFWPNPVESDAHRDIMCCGKKKIQPCALQFFPVM